MNGLRQVVAESIEDLPRAGEDGFFELDGMRYGTAYAWATLFKLTELKTPDFGVDGFDAANHFRRGGFYSEAQMKALYPERFCEDIPHAGEDGFFSLRGVLYGHRMAWANRLGVTLQKELPDGIDGYDAANHFRRGGFYSEAQMKALYPERFAGAIPIADSQGVFLLDGEYYGNQTAWQSFITRGFFRKLSGGLDGYTSANKFVSEGFYRKQQLILAYPNLFQKHVEALLASFEVGDFSDWLASLRHFYDFLELGTIDRPYPFALVNLFLDWSRSLSGRFPFIKRYLKLLEDRPKQVVESNREGQSHECVYLSQKDFELWMEQRQPAKETSDDLISRAQSGDRIAEADFVRQYERLVKNLAYKYKGALPLEDAVQEGMIGLLRALQKYDPSKGSFVNHAKWWVRAAITNVAPGAGTSLDLPKSLLWARRMLTQVAGETPISSVPSEELARRTGLTQKRVQAVLRDSLPRVFSLDAPLPGTDGAMRFHETIPGPADVDPIVQTAFRQFLLEASRCTTAAGYNVYWDLFADGYLGDGPMRSTFASEKGISRETVRLRIRAALELVLNDPVCARLLLELHPEG